MFTGRKIEHDDEDEVNVDRQEYWKQVCLGSLTHEGQP